MSGRAVKAWYLVHKWTSLVCTVFLLMLCLTGLPLIFYDELYDALSGVEVPAMAADTPRADLDRIVAAGLARFPGTVTQYVAFDAHDRNIAYVTVGATPEGEDTNYATIDARTAEVLHASDGLSVLDVILQLHVDMFAGLPGELFLGLMGVLFVVAIVSGVALYSPFMRKIAFGTVRAAKAPRTKWLDLHNLLGIVTLTWAIVVGSTGVLNTLATPILAVWQRDQLAAMVAPYRGKPLPSRLSSLQAAVAKAERAAPDTQTYFIAYPGTAFSSPHHYGVFMRGKTPLTSRLYRPVLIDAETGDLAAMREMPWYVKALFVSQPLHFGDYGGLLLKIVWALLDVVTIIVLGSGIYLWLGRRKTPLEARLNELLRGGREIEASSLSRR